ncbi:hypothetical protein DYB30_014082, partial [Aphanomyces astaci]
CRTIATPNVAVQSKGEVLASPPSNASKKAAVVLLDSQKELESQFQMGLELDQCLEECATLYFENHQLTDKITTIEAALASVQDQQAVLYREYIGQQQSFKAHKHQLDTQLAASQTIIDEQTIKLNR